MPRRSINLRPVPAPARALAGQEVVFLDEADQHVKVIDAAGVVTDLEDGGGSVPTGTPLLVDLGAFDFADLIDGPVVVYEPDGPTFLSLAVAEADFVATNGGHPAALQLTADDDTAAILASPARWLGGGFTNQISGISWWSAVVTDPVRWVLVINNDTPILARPSAWSEGSYDHNALLIENAHFWQNTGSSGDSGGSKPDFGGNVGGSVTDGDLTWQDRGNLPTQGRIHLYALIAALGGGPT